LNKSLIKLLNRSPLNVVFIFHNHASPPTVISELLHFPHHHSTTQRHVLFTKLPPLLFLLAISLPFALAGYSIDQFKHWYPEFGFIFSHILATNCTAPYATYLLAQKHPIAADDPDGYTGLGQTNQLAQPVVKCILDSTSSFVMANMGSAQVLLGLTPTILATLGPSSEETSMIFVIARRPVLSVSNE
jgi:hypothetical protein